MTALAAEPFEAIDRMSFLDLQDVAEMYGFWNEVKHLKSDQSNEIRRIVKDKVRQHKETAYASVWGE